MANANRCPDCGGVANHLITDINGKNLYQCSTGLTAFEVDTDELTGHKFMSRRSRIVQCGTVMDGKRKRAEGTYAYPITFTNDKGDVKTKLRTISFTNGKERRN